jgi:predicted ATP-grasp superfamily ATP-dependent carboligase
MDILQLFLTNIVPVLITAVGAFLAGYIPARRTYNVEVMKKTFDYETLRFDRWRKSIQEFLPTFKQESIKDQNFYEEIRSFLDDPTRNKIEKSAFIQSDELPGLIQKRILLEVIAEMEREFLKKISL